MRNKSLKYNNRIEQAKQEKEKIMDLVKAGGVNIELAKQLILNDDNLLYHFSSDEFVELLCDIPEKGVIQPIYYSKNKKFLLNYYWNHTESHPKKDLELFIPHSSTVPTWSHYPGSIQFSVEGHKNRIKLVNLCL